MITPDANQIKEEEATSLKTFNYVVVAALRAILTVVCLQQCYYVVALYIIMSSGFEYFVVGT